jgi:hypothetical protein
MGSTNGNRYPLAEEQGFSRDHPMELGLDCGHAAGLQTLSSYPTCEAAD